MNGLIDGAVNEGPIEDATGMQSELKRYLEIFEPLGVEVGCFVRVIGMIPAGSDLSARWTSDVH